MVLLGAISTFGFVTHFLPYITIITKLRQIPILKQSKESENIIEFNLNPKRKKSSTGSEHRTPNKKYRTSNEKIPNREKMGVTNTEFNHNAPTTERKSSESFRFTTVWRELIKLLHEQVKFFEFFEKSFYKIFEKKSKFEKNGN